MKSGVQQDRNHHHHPDFPKLNDDAIVCQQLRRAEIVQIVDLMVNLLDERLKDRDISLDLTQSARELLAERGYDSSMGARPLRRTIQREIEDPLSEKMLFGEITPGSIVLVDVVDGADGKEFTFVSTPKADVPDTPPIETAGTD